MTHPKSLSSQARDTWCTDISKRRHSFQYKMNSIVLTFISNYKKQNISPLFVQKYLKDYN